MLSISNSSKVERNPDAVDRSAVDLSGYSFQTGLQFTSPEKSDEQKLAEVKERQDNQSQSRTSTISEKAHLFLDRALQLIAADPKAEASIMRAAVSLGYDVVPFLGPVKKFADARALYRTADPILMEEGRRLCVIALVEAAFDVGTLGGSAFIPDELITGLRTAGDYYRRVGAITKGAKLSKDPASLLAGVMLKIPYLAKAVDLVLTPPKKDGEAE